MRNHSNVIVVYYIIESVYGYELDGFLVEVMKCVYDPLLNQIGFDVG